MEYFEFLDGGVSPYHVVAQSEKELEKQGFIPLNECEEWHLEPGKKYFVTRNQSGIIGFCIPEETPRAYHMIASHSDSPTFRIKKQTAGVKGYTKAEVEGYGGMIYSSWLDRPLSVAGRVIVKKDNCLTSRLVYADKDLCVIPNLAIHFNREINNGYKYNRQVDLCPLFSAGELKKGAFDAFVAGQLGIEPEHILGKDLFLVNRQKGSVWGARSEFVSSPKLDDLQCAYASLQAFLQAENDKAVNVYCCFDNEEVGSNTKQGAMSTFLADVLERINTGLGKNREEYLQAQARSFLVRCDNAHAVHPNHPNKTDAQNHVWMNQGECQSEIYNGCVQPRGIYPDL